MTLQMHQNMYLSGKGLINIEIENKIVLQTRTAVKRRTFMLQTLLNSYMYLTIFFIENKIEIFLK